MPMNTQARIAIIAKWLIAVFIFLYCVLWAVSPYVIKPVAQSFLDPYKLELTSDSKITFNPFLTRVTIRNLALQQQGQTLAQIEKANVQISLIQLLFKKVVFQEATFDGLMLKINSSDEKLVIAGVDVSASNSSASQDKSAEDQKESTSANESADYKIVLPEMVIKNSQVEASINGTTHLLTINDIKVSKANLSPLKQQLALASAINVDGANIDINANLKQEGNQGELSAQLDLTHYPLEKIQHFLPQEIKIAGFSNITISSATTWNKQKFDVLLDKVTIAHNDLLVSKENISASVGLQQLSFEQLKLMLDDGKLQDIKGQGTLTVGATKVHSQEQLLAGFETLSIESFDIKKDEKITLNLPVLTMDKIIASQVNNTETPSLVTIDNVQLKELLLDETQLALADFAIENLQVNATLDKNKQLINLIKLANDSTNSENESAVQTPMESEVSTEQQQVAGSATNENEQLAQNNNQDKPKFDISLGKFYLHGQNTVHFHDESVNPSYSREIYIDELSLDNLSTLTPERKSPIKLLGRSNKYASFDYVGNITPFSLQPSYQINGELNELSLPELSPYVKEALQFELLTGQLSTKLEFNMVADKIDGDLSLLISGLETTAADDHQADSLKDKTAMPINVALGLLKDSNGDVDLSIPFSGTTTDPSFGISSFLTLITKKAVISATQSYLMNTFVPYANVVSVALSAGEYILKLRFEDLNYQPKQIVIDSDSAQSQYTEQFALLMKDKKDAKVKVCGIAVLSDIGLTSGTKLSQATTDELKQIADQRQQAFKAYIIEHYQINSARMLLCAPQIDEENEAKPRIVLSAL